MPTMPRPRREGRIVPWVAHMHPWVLATAGVLLFLPTSDPIGWLGMALFAGGLYAQLRHAYNYLCPRCAAATPLDGQGEAEKRKRSLRALHWLSEGRRGRVIALIVLAFFVLPPIAALIVGKSPILAVFLPLVWIFWVVESFLYLRHLPVQPWCPQCHWDDGGDDEESPILPEPVAPSVTP